AGGGVPGIPLAIARSDWNVVLVDSNRKKVAFLTQAAIELSLRNVQAVAARIEELPTEPRFDVIISRAFADLRTFAELSAPQLAQEGKRSEERRVGKEWRIRKRGE